MEQTEFRTFLLEHFSNVSISLERKLWSLQQLSKLIKKSAQISEEYAKNIEKLIERTEPTLWSIKSSYDQLKKSLSEVAKVHNLASSKICETAVHDLDTAFTELEQERKKVTMQGNALTKQYSESKKALLKAKESYDKINRELELTQYQLEDAENNPKKKSEVDKLNKKINKLKQDIVTESEAYQTQINNTNMIQNDFYTTGMPNIMDSFQDIYLRRNKAIQSATNKYIKYAIMESTEVSSPWNKLQESITSISAESDLNEFIQNTSVDSVKVPPQFVFENYVKKGRETNEDKKHKFIWRKGPKEEKINEFGSYSPYSKVSTGEETLNSVFGTHISVLLEREKNIHPGLKVPYILVFCADKIISLGGTSTVGIFRLNGLTSNIEKIRQSINKGSYPEHITSASINDISSIIKLFFRQLPEPLIPDDIYSKCFSTPPISPEDFFKLLPEVNRDILEFMVGFLQKFLDPKTVEVTKMSDMNIAAVFAPCFFRCPYSDPLAILRAAGEEQMFLSKILSNYNSSDAYNKSINAKDQKAEPSLKLESEVYSNDNKPSGDNKESKEVNEPKKEVPIENKEANKEVPVETKETNKEVPVETKETNKEVPVETKETNEEVPVENNDTKKEVPVENKESKKDIEDNK